MKSNAVYVQPADRVIAIVLLLYLYRWLLIASPSRKRHIGATAKFDWFIDWD